MPRNRGKQGERPTERKHNEQVRRQSAKRQSQPRDTPRPADYDKVGPLSIEGVEASDLPDKGRGDVFTIPSKEAGRNLPQNTGQYGSGADTGLRADPEVAEAAKSGHRKRN